MEDLKEAAHLAHLYSKAKTKKAANVDYTQVANVKKGGVSGEVELAKFKTLRPQLT